jgi:hypothetical protein
MNRVFEYELTLQNGKKIRQTLPTYSDTSVVHEIEDLLSEIDWDTKRRIDFNEPIIFKFYTPGE